MHDLRWPTYRTYDLTLEGAAPVDTGASMRVRDREGHVYLDAVNGIGCAPLGHGHPLWIEALTTQLGRLSAAANTYRTTPQQQLATRLAELFPVTDARVFLCNTGAEATEAAIKLALRATGRDVIIAFDGAFHGRTLGALALTANRKFRDPYLSCLDDQLPDRFARLGVTHVPFGDLEAVARRFHEYAGRIAAVFIEPVQGQSGVFPARREFLVGLRRLCTEHGALLGIDEIQCGSGRSGRFSAWTTIVGEDDPDTCPDMLWLAKALGGGFPIGACLARADLARAMGPGSHGTTFGGNPAACAAALATLRIIQEEGLLERAERQLPTLRAISRADPEPRVKDIRGLGAMIAIELHEGQGPKDLPLAEAVRREGLLVTATGTQTIRLLLPYAAGEAELEEAWTALKRALGPRT